VRPLFRRRTTSEADATVAAVTMTERCSYGEAKVRVDYAVEPLNGSPFGAVREAKVKMKFLPQPGQRVRVRYDCDKQELMDILTPPGSEGAPPDGSARTVEIPWNDFGHTTFWADGSRRS
jgi:hypothetical protein